MAIPRPKKKRRKRSPRLSSNKETSQPAIYNLDGTRSRQAPLARNIQKSQLLLANVIDNLFVKHTASMILFITLTIPGVRSTKEAHRRLNSLLNDVRPRYGKYAWVLQPQRSGVIHYHLLVPVTFDTHRGTDLDAWANRTLYDDAARLELMNGYLRAESDWWQARAPLFGFGRIEVAPVYSTGEQVSSYLTTQDWRSGHWPFEEEKSFRFWGCSRSARAGSVKFSWYNLGGQLCRLRLREWAQQKGCNSLEELRTKLGDHWGWQFHYHLEQVLRGDSTTHGNTLEPMTEGCVSSRTGSAGKDTPQADRADGFAVPRWRSVAQPPSAPAEGAINANDHAAGTTSPLTI